MEEDSDMFQSAVGNDNMPPPLWKYFVFDKENMESHSRKLLHVGPIITDQNLNVKVKEVEVVLTYEDIACFVILASKLPKT